MVILGDSSELLVFSFGLSLRLSSVLDKKRIVCRNAFYKKIPKNFLIRPAYDLEYVQFMTSLRLFMGKKLRNLMILINKYKYFYVVIQISIFMTIWYRYAGYSFLYFDDVVI